MNRLACRRRPLLGLLPRARNRELAEIGRILQIETGAVFRALKNGEHVSGVYRQRIQLSSGRYAVLDDGIRFSLVPWHPAIEQALGRRLSVVVQGQSASWRLDRSLGVVGR
ncbi:MAG: DUF3363 domain-containing protein [Ramlibacter sp.]|nr:DUF3363 domain-containing protein [Ramlibacter sp.]